MSGAYVKLPALVMVAGLALVGGSSLEPASAGARPASAASRSEASDARGASGSQVETSNPWRDPFPKAPAANDSRFVGQKWHDGPRTGDDRIDYLARVPSGDTSRMPLIVVGAPGDGALMAHRQLYESALVIFIGPGGSRNRWLRDKIDAGDGAECSPACPAWMFVPAEAVRDVLRDFAAHVRFAHDRVQFFGFDDTRYLIYRALDPVLQPYLAGVAHGVYAEWQQASCPAVSKAGATPPRMFFSWGGCDESFCPTMDCLSVIASRGYEVDAASRGDAAPEQCECPGAAGRPHLAPASAAIRAATYRWLLSNRRK